MFEALSDKLSGVFDRLCGRGALSEEDVAEALREVRVALLDADVALPVVRDFVAKVRERAVAARRCSPRSRRPTRWSRSSTTADRGAGRRGEPEPPQPDATLADRDPDGRAAGWQDDHYRQAALRWRAERGELVAVSIRTAPPPGAAAELAGQAEVESLPIVAGEAGADRQPRAWTRAGAKASTSSSSTPPGGCRSTKR